jgi:TRAP transporter TAXI family solute receptor
MRTRNFLIILIFVFLTVGIGNAQIIGVGTSGAGSQTYSVGAAISKVISEKSGMQMRVQPSGGGNIYQPLVNSGDLEFCVASVFDTTDAIKGDVIFKDRPQPNLRVVTVLMPLRAGIYVQKDSPTKSIKDLKGKRVPSGFTTQKLILACLEGHLANAGLSYDDVKAVPTPNVISNADDFAQGKTDAFFFALGPGKVLDVSAKVGGVRLLSIDPTPEAMVRMHKIIPMAYPSKVTPESGVHGVVAPTFVMTYDLVLLSSTKIADETVYRVTKTLHGSKAGLAGSFKPLAEFSPEEMAKQFKGLEYHSGAIKFYKEQGLWPPK